jgi:hypothetical protein
MIQRVKVCRDQINRIRKPQEANILAKQQDVGPATVPSCHSQHRLRTINRKNWNPSRDFQMPREQPSATANIRSRAKVDSIPFHQLLKRAAQPKEEGKTHS